MNLVRADHTDLSAIRLLLTEADLPHSDITAARHQHFITLRDESGVRAVVGLEQHGSVALLRSLVVSAELRGEGHGIELTRAAESLSAELGLTATYLLTTTAETFFQRLGYRRIDRDEAPREIRATSEFSSLCPASAVVMVKP